MNISELCIKRPVFATVLSLVLIVMGLSGYLYLNTRFLPKFTQDTIMIFSHYPGASAKLVETSVTTPIEDAISGVEGVEDIRSTSQQGVSQVRVTLLPGFDLNIAANKIRNKISMSSYELPNSIKPPVVMAGFGDGDLVDFGFTDNTQSREGIRDFLERYVQDNMEQLPGVSNIDIYGGNHYAMRIWLNPQKMAARGLSVDNIQNAIKNSNLQMPAGKLYTHQLLYPITATTKLTSVSQFANVVIANKNNKIVRLKDVANVALGPNNDPQTIVDINGKPGVILTVYNTSDGNPMSTAAAAKKYIQQLHSQLPPSMHVTTLFDQSVYMQGSIHEVYISIALSILGVGLIIFLFLGRIRSMLIPLVTIPICVTATFGLLYFFGFTINLITLIAIVLSIGLVVDDAIVMLENIHRHIENGETPIQAAIKGSKEISFAVIAMTITLAAVYAPIGLMHGNMADIFRPFALTLAAAVVVSGFVALTLSPMMCSRLLQPETGKKHGYHYYSERMLNGLTKRYKKWLSSILRHRLWIVIIALLFAVGGVFLLKSLSFSVLPRADIGLGIVSINAPVGSSAPYNNRQLAKLQQLLLPYNNVIQNSASFAAETSSFNDANSIFLSLKPYDQRTMTSQQLADHLNTLFAKHPDLDASAISLSFGGDNMQHDLEFYVMRSGSYMQLYNTTQNLIKVLGRYPGLRHVDTDMKFNSQQYDLNVNRDLAASLQVNVSDIDNTVASLWAGLPISTFDMGGRTYDVITQAQQPYLRSLNAIDNFFVKNATGQLIPLSNLVTLSPILTQSNLYHYNRLRAAQITANIAPGYKLGDVVKYLQANLTNLLPSDAKYAFTGSAKQIVDNSGDMGLMLALAFVFIYLVLAAQFESFLDPFIILLAVPLSIVSALAALKLIGGGLDLYTIIGLVTLIGLISKHGILITQFANKLQDQGMAMHEALIEAASIRLRPILMTTCAMICGALPLLLAAGAGSTSRHELATVIIAGLFFGTFFSLIVVPITYSYANKLKRKRGPSSSCRT